VPVRNSRTSRDSEVVVPWRSGLGPRVTYALLSALGREFPVTVDVLPVAETFATDNVLFKGIVRLETTVQ
jgi:hypothetical protein